MEKAGSVPAAVSSSHPALQLRKQLVLVISSFRSLADTPSCAYTAGPINLNQRPAGHHSIRAMAASVPVPFAALAALALLAAVSADSSSSSSSDSSGDDPSPEDVLEMGVQECVRKHQPAMIGGGTYDELAKLTACVSASMEALAAGAAPPDVEQQLVDCVNGNTFPPELQPTVDAFLACVKAVLPP